MKPCRLRVFTRDAATPIDERIYGSFIEHLGRAVYTGIYEPGHPEADAKGLRTDVVKAVRELQVPIVRYPGGNFVSNYYWEDGVGPLELRPRRLDLAWRTTESNQFGTDEFLQWCRAVGTSPMMAVNLGTRGVSEALALAEYCNHPGGSAWSDLRIRHGFSAPYDIRVWCLGNEMDGPWQTGHKTAHEYGRLAAETARALRQFDPTLELVLCGSSSRDMSTYLTWEQTVLEEAYDLVDYLSLHCYLSESACSGDEDYLASPLKMEAQIRETIAACDFVRAKCRHKKAMMLSFDEWNIWDPKRHDDNFPAWCEAPAQLEQVYTMKDALVFAGMLLVLMRHASRIRMACLAQLVNVIAPIMTARGGRVWKQTIFYPYLHASTLGRGELLESRVDSSSYDTEKWGAVPWVDSIVTRDSDGRHITVFALNRSSVEDVLLEIFFVDGEVWRAVEHLILSHENLEATNFSDAPDTVIPRSAPLLLEGVRLPRLSWNVVRFEIGN